MNKILNELKKETNYTITENGAIAHKSTLNKVYDMFAFGGAYRTRTDADCILLFKNAIEENETLALKCLFYLRDIRGGQGERRFFRVCFKWLCDNYPDAAKRNLDKLSEYGRWDDLLYATDNTKMEDYALFLIKEQLILDLDSTTPSLLGKWLPSENASSRDTKKMATKVRKYLKMTHKEYRKALAKLRTRINIVEKLMSENRWDEIEFDKLPSKAGFKYRNAFAARDIIAKKYEKFAKDENTKVNSKDLYPYEIAKKAIDATSRYYDTNSLSSTDRAMINKYWENLPDYLNGSDQSAICVCDTSGSMTSTYGSSIRPIDVAISLSLYMAERNKGAFKNHFITFSSQPSLVECEGIDFVDKVQRIYKNSIIDNTNLDAVFELLKTVALKTSKEDLPSRIIVISDMEIDEGASGHSYWSNSDFRSWTSKNAQTNMERIREEWAEFGLELPKIVYWNVCARNNVILDGGQDVSFVSGASPVLFEQICKGVTGLQLCLDKLNSERYEQIK